MSACIGVTGRLAELGTPDLAALKVQADRA
jgi:hypothetical protein